MQMIDVMKRLADLDKGNPTVVNPMVAETAHVDEMITEGKKAIDLPKLPEPNLGDLRALSGFKTKLTESTIAECGMMPMGAPMPPMMPASLNMSAGNAGEIVAMMRGIMDLAKGDVPSQSMMPTMGAPMPKMMGDLDRDGDHDMDDHGMEKDNDVLTGGPAVSGPTFGDDDGAVDDSGADELADMMKKIRTGEPVKITTDMPVKVTSDEPIKGTTDKLNKVSGDGPSKDEGALGAIGGGIVGGIAGGPLGALTGAAAGDQLTDTKNKENYDNTPKPETKGYGDGNDFANIINKVRSADMTTTPANSGSNPMPDNKKKEAVDPLAAFESKLMSEYKKFVEEDSAQKTMSRAAKGHEKYGKAGMQALAKAGREGKDLDKIRDKYNKYDEASHQANVTMKHVNASDASPKVKAAIGKASKDIKPGVKGYADRAAALNAAGVKR
jgi:gas vesicle protein